MIKIGIITDAVDDAAGGIQTYVRGLVDSLLKTDRKNQYYLIHYKKNADSFYKNRKEIIIPIKPIPFYREFRKIILMPILLKKYNLDIVHETAQIGPFFLPAKFKKIITIHDLVPLIYPKTNNIITWIHHKIGLWLVLKRADSVIAVSNSTKKDILKFFNIPQNKITVIYEGHFNYYTPVKNKKQLDEIKRKYKLYFKFILFVGTLEPRKNISRVIKSFIKIKKEFPELRLVIVGKKGWKYNEIFRLINQLNIGNSVIFTGYVPEEDLPAINSLAEVLVYPSLYEGFGLSALGAIKCGCPVVSSNCSSIPEVINDAGVLVDPTNVSKISAGILKVLKDRSFRNKIIKKGLAQGKRFNWKKFAKKTMRVYEQATE